MSNFLIVDDDIDLADTLKDLFELQGHDVAVAATGQQALLNMHSQPFDLVMLDWQLPDMDGVAVCLQYRASGGKAAILMLTGVRDTTVQQAARDAGATDILTKPFSVDHLMASVAATLKASGQN